MLITVMHNNYEYLNYLSQLAKNEGIIDVNIIEEGNFGTRILGGGSNFIFSRGQMISAYNKALVAIVKGEKKIKAFLDAIKQNCFLDRINFDDKGFVCTLPFHCIKGSATESVTKKKEESTMKIADFLKEERIILDLKSRSKKEAIKELGSLLVKANEILNFDLFIKDVFDREAISTTGISNEIAIPHARTDSVSDFVVAFGRSSQGVEFESLDKKPAKLIFLIGTPKNKDLNSYLMILANLTRILNKKDFRELLAKALNPKEIIEVFSKQNNNSQ